ncbi:MAG: hypothetical protein A2908_01120 [Candidatus Staskawiczbacteria bacterium RIFCSPLOWO2_01_FULL_38_12b]|uniref:Peptidase C39 domain-containing protein n=1 Tax=Candidatus Staskawiczbacteria bacterium RIFCSPLOWO2_01_FULL_38_12b TaxID=1802214 RepID=A0A1G2IEJ6_9BACT|nr:MAG: hypothetical protein A2908_01120 [Candidatus Staskawiczbacteria bacterium RIFCSPLOWO2_01_FULL_38_12b]
MKIKPIKQRDDSACGPTSIQMILNYFKVPYTFKEIAKVSGYKKRGGLYNKDLVLAVEKFGLNVKEKANSTWADLGRFNKPNKVIVVSWMMKGYIGHFSVVEKVNKDSIELADPDTGKITKMKKIIFLRLWMDYEVKEWYPIKNTDIQLRWMCIVSKKK